MNTFQEFDERCYSNYIVEPISCIDKPITELIPINKRFLPNVYYFNYGDTTSGLLNAATNKIIKLNPAMHFTNRTIEAANSYYGYRVKNYLYYLSCNTFIELIMNSNRNQIKNIYEYNIAITKKVLDPETLTYETFGSESYIAELGDDFHGTFKLSKCYLVMTDIKGTRIFDLESFTLIKNFIGYSCGTNNAHDSQNNKHIIQLLEYDLILLWNHDNIIVHDLINDIQILHIKRNQINYDSATHLFSQQSNPVSGQQSNPFDGQPIDTVFVVDNLLKINDKLYKLTANICTL